MAQHRVRKINFWSWDCISVGAQTQFSRPAGSYLRTVVHCRKLKPIESMSTCGKYPEENADRLTLSLMAMSAPIRILGRPEFQKIPPEQFHPFEAVDELPTDVEIKEDTNIGREFFLRFYNRCAAYEDAVCTICCTHPGAAGVTAVMVEYLKTTSSSDGDKLLESIRQEVDQGSKNFQCIVVTTNGRVSEEKKVYIIKVLDTIQKIDFAMNLVESEDDRQKAEGAKVNSPSSHQPIKYR